MSSSTLVCAGLLLLAAAVHVASGAACVYIWDLPHPLECLECGTGPFCEGRCRDSTVAGYTRQFNFKDFYKRMGNVKGAWEGCWTGNKVICCKQNIGLARHLLLDRHAG